LKRILFIILGLVMAMSLVLGACSSNETTPASTSAALTTTSTTSKPATTAPAAATTTAAAPTGEKYGGVLKIGLQHGPSLPIGLPWEFGPDSGVMATPCVQRLINIRDDGSIAYLLVTSWELTADKKAIILHLRKGVKFHDGSDFNAEVCKWNLEQQLVAKKTTDWTSIDIVDDYTLRLNIKEYQNTMLLTFAGSTAAMISKKAYDTHDLDWVRWNPVGTGPFRLKEYSRDAKIIWERNPDYWDKGKPYLDHIDMTVIPDVTVAKLALQKGEINMLIGGIIFPLTARDVSEFVKTGLYDGWPGSAGSPYLFIPDSMHQNSPWSDVRVRYAASYALDRELLAQAIGFGVATPAYQFMESTPAAHIPNLVKTAYNLDKAKALLKEAGYPSGFKTVIHAMTSFPSDYVKAVSAQWAAAGIIAELDFPTSGKYNEMRYASWDGLMAQSVGTFDNVNRSFTFHLGDIQFPAFKRPAGWKEGVAASLVSPEPDPKLIQAVMQLLYDDMTLICFLEVPSYTFTNKAVHNTFGSFPKTLNYEDIWIEKSGR
jgi:peptide/nickel transport system substrate-binding protein